MAHSTTPSLGMQDYFTTTLSSQVNVGDTVINLNAVPTASEGYLVIDPNNASTREVIYYNSKTSSTVVCPDAVQGTSRGLGGTTVQSHLAGVAVEMRMVAEYWNAIQSGQSWAVGSIGATAFASGWAPGLATPNTVTYNGNRSYSLVFNGTDLTPTISNGMRLKLTRTVTAPTQCTSLNGTTQFYSKTSPAGMTFTNNFVASAWVKLNAYQYESVASRYNGTSGWRFDVNASGQVLLIGFNAGAANTFQIQSYQSLPLNKWVHIAAQIDMTNTTNDGSNNYVMIDGANVPAVAARTGTNPTALIQAGNLEIGSLNGGGSPFNGKIAQVAIFSAKITIATMQGYISQGLAGTETSLISAYSFNNSINDLNANANNLTANGSAVATNPDSPFGLQADGTTAGTTEYAIVTKTAFSTNTTLTVQVPEGNAIPTSGGVSAVSYSTQKAPYGFPDDKNKWTVTIPFLAQSVASTPSNNTYYQPSPWSITVPIGTGYEVGYRAIARGHATGTTSVAVLVTLSTTTNSETDSRLTTRIGQDSPSSGVITITGTMTASTDITPSTATTYNLLHQIQSGATVGATNGFYSPTLLFFSCPFI